VAIFDYGRSPDGVFYYAMEYLDGTDLESLVRDHGPQPSDRVAAILAQVCGALDEAHHRGLVHRDIKPANILLCQRGREPDIAKVVDFGLIKEVGGSDGSQPHLVAGTPEYLPPEAVTDADKVGPHSDLYALGAVGYFLLTGQPVFTGATDADICIKHVEATPVPPSQRTDRPIAAGLERLILRCLEKDPARRPEHAAALGESLRALPRTGDWTAEQSRTWWAEFERARRDGRARRATAAPSTMTVDLRARRAAR
jgi:serine/threonine protein kinase